MQPFTTVSGPAAALCAANTDTDVIMPKQFLKGIDRNGLDHGTLHDLRFDTAGAPRTDFVLNRPEWVGSGSQPLTSKRTFRIRPDTATRTVVVVTKR